MNREHDSMAILARHRRPTSDSPTLVPESLGLLEQRLEGEIRRLQQTVRRLARTEFERGGHALDVTALRQGHEANQALRARYAGALSEWIGALRRLRDAPEEFGICESCRRPIPWARLELLPTTRRCVGC